MTERFIDRVTASVSAHGHRSRRIADPHISRVENRAAGIEVNAFTQDNIQALSAMKRRFDDRAIANLGETGLCSKPEVTQNCLAGGDACKPTRWRPERGQKNERSATMNRVGARQPDWSRHSPSKNRPSMRARLQSNVM